MQKFFNTMANKPLREPQTRTTHRFGSSFSFLLVLAVLLTLVLYYAAIVVHEKPSTRLLLAPMIGQLGFCKGDLPLPSDYASDPIFAACSTEEGSSAPVIEATLTRLGPRFSRNGQYELGYTLNVPLLKLLVERNGQWVPDTQEMNRLVKTIAQTDRRLILYLFSTHFSVSAPIEPILAADRANIAHTFKGPLGVDKHYGMDVYPWSIARTDNSLTQSRMLVIRAFVQAMCDQPKAVRNRLAGITLLGEVHQLFPSFESGMGFDGTYQVSDYSASSISDFRFFLRDRFHTVEALNAFLGGANFSGFEVVQPPAKNIRTEKLENFWEHTDSYASGHLPVQGWLAPHPRLTGWVQIYLNGVLLARKRAGLSRQDVREHLPAIGTADVGWRHDLDFRPWLPGIHRISAMAEVHTGLPVLLGEREVVVMDRKQSAQVKVPTSALPEHDGISDVLASVDSPKDRSSYFFNPLAALWSEFRAQQVVKYLQFVEQPLVDSCLASIPRYVHQLFPYANPSWDAEKYAVDASLTRAGDLRLGISLYGEATYGESFFEWKRLHHQAAYGITEFHPLRAMNSAELTLALDRHHDNGAQFLSFFLEGRGALNRPFVPAAPTVPFIGEANAQNGSMKLYRSFQQLLAD